MNMATEEEEQSLDFQKLKKTFSEPVTKSVSQQTTDARPIKSNGLVGKMIKFYETETTIPATKTVTKTITKDIGKQIPDSDMKSKRVVKNILPWAASGYPRKVITAEGNQMVKLDMKVETVDSKPTETVKLPLVATTSSDRGSSIRSIFPLGIKDSPEESQKTVDNQISDSHIVNTQKETVELKAEEAVKLPLAATTISGEVSDRDTSIRLRSRCTPIGFRLRPKSFPEEPPDINFENTDKVVNLDKHKWSSNNCITNSSAFVHKENEDLVREKVLLEKSEAENVISAATTFSKTVTRDVGQQISDDYVRKPVRLVKKISTLESAKTASSSLASTIHPKTVKKDVSEQITYAGIDNSNEIKTSSTMNSLNKASPEDKNAKRQSNLEHNVQMFSKKQGTTDKGKDYEHLFIANLILQLVTDEQVEDFNLSSNNAEYGKFDDAVLEVKHKDDINWEIYAIQLKHIENRVLSNAHLENENGNFSISTYLQNYEQSVDEKFQKVNGKLLEKLSSTTKLILFTNAKYTCNRTVLKLKSNIHETEIEVDIHSSSENNVIKASHSGADCSKSWQKLKKYLIR